MVWVFGLWPCEATIRKLLVYLQATEYLSLLTAFTVASRARDALVNY